MPVVRVAFHSIFFCVRNTTSWQMTGCTVVTLALWLIGVFTLRYSLKLLLIYKGWMYEERGRGRQVSTATKLWVLLVRVLSGWNKPKLYSFQGSLPRLPLPSLHSTMQRVRVLFICSQLEINFLIICCSSNCRVSMWRRLVSVKGTTTLVEHISIFLWSRTRDRYQKIKIPCECCWIVYK